MLPIKFSDPFDQFIEPARERPQLWRFLVGMMIIVVVFIAVTLIVTLGVAAISPAGNYESDLATGRTVPALITIFLSIGGATFGVWAAVRLLHRRGLMSVIGPIRPAMRNFGIAACVMLALQFLWLIVWSFFFDATPQNTALTTLTYLPIAVFIVLFQSSAEEILCRGYMMQQLAARFKSPVIWFVLPQLFFAALHWDPEAMGSNIWITILALFAFGLMWADLTRITGNLGAACGWHFANNLFLMTVIGNNGQLDAIVYKVTPYTTLDAPMIVVFVDLLVGIATWVILRRILRP